MMMVSLLCSGGDNDLPWKEPRMLQRYRTALIRLLHSELPVPGLLLPLIRRLYQIGVYAGEATNLLYKWLILVPVMRAVCTRVGSGLRIERMPYIRGVGEIHIGTQVYLSGRIGIGLSGRSPSVVPILEIGDGTFIGHECSFNLRHSIRIGRQCLLAGGVVIQDNDGHPIDAEARRAGEPAPESAVAAVTIADGVWIGRRAMILKGVTLGENAIVGAGSVVLHDVPANTIVAGNPARVIRTLQPSECLDSDTRKTLLPSDDK
jgi:acetyltransferase-like isoleucine patch superfamily enzyme